MIAHGKGSKMSNEQTVLEYLYDAKVFGLELSGDKKTILFYEMYDQHNHADLSKDELAELIDELRALHRKMKD